MVLLAEAAKQDRKVSVNTVRALIQQDVKPQYVISSV